MSRWITVEVESVLHVQNGRDVILLDRSLWRRGGKLVLRLSERSVAELKSTLANVATTEDQN